MLHGKDIAIDWVKVSTMFVVAQWLAGKSLGDRSWQMSSLYTLLGFSAYHLVTRQLFEDPGPEHEHHKGHDTQEAIQTDWLKVGTMLVVSRMLSGSSLADGDWIRQGLAVLVGFTIYNLVTARYIQGKELTYNPKLRLAIDDWAKVGTMLAVSRVLSCQSLTDPSWIAASMGTLVGFTVYDLGTSHLIDHFFA